MSTPPGIYLGEITGYEHLEEEYTVMFGEFFDRTVTNPEINTNEEARDELELDDTALENLWPEDDDSATLDADFFYTLYQPFYYYYYDFGINRDGFIEIMKFSLFKSEEELTTPGTRRWNTLARSLFPPPIMTPRDRRFNIYKTAFDKLLEDQDEDEDEDDLYLHLDTLIGIYDRTDRHNHPEKSDVVRELETAYFSQNYPDGISKGEFAELMERAYLDHDHDQSAWKTIFEYLKNGSSYLRLPPPPVIRGGNKRKKTRCKKGSRKNKKTNRCQIKTKLGDRVLKGRNLKSMNNK
uniref:Uncharacterized protein n=1 Tax=viral metagenome TaxID=1070528 RepID=A0A6C0I4K8_9ZZZZ